MLKILTFWSPTFILFDLENHIDKFRKDVKEIKSKIIYTDIECADDRNKMLLKSGRFGYYLECENKHKKSIPADILKYEEMLEGNVYIKDKLKDIPDER